MISRGDNGSEVEGDAFKEAENAERTYTNLRRPDREKKQRGSRLEAPQRLWEQLNACKENREGFFLEQKGGNLGTGLEESQRDRAYRGKESKREISRSFWVSEERSKSRLGERKEEKEKIRVIGESIVKFGYKKDSEKFLFPGLGRKIESVDGEIEEGDENKRLRD